MTVVTIPYKPRPLQLNIHEHLERFNVLVCHRRFGKTVLCINELIRRAIECQHKNPRMMYVCPLWKQAKSVAWDYLKEYTLPIPGRTVNESELRVDLPGGRRIQLLGADNVDAIRGQYADLVVMDEYAQMSPRLWGEVIRPLLADRKGGAIFIGTPMGHNAFFDIFEHAKKTDGWFAAMYKASETGILDYEELRDLKQNLAHDEYLQELECSFTAAVKGSFYGHLMAEADEEGRIGKVPHDRAVTVETWWDLGIGDDTVIWFAQRVGREVHLIDYYASNSVGLEHYAGILHQWRDEKKYKYDAHILPHDAKARELTSGKSRVETLQALGIEPTVLENARLEDGIEAARNLIPRCWFDAERCHEGIECLRMYRREWDDQRRVFKRTPLHDFTSHAADAFRYGALHRGKKKDRKPLVYPERSSSSMRV